ncbi:MAG: hypothetical protein QNI84_17345 [Henriciella sp.]|nr:hypothetical protein [Henriciella sp.]
MRFVTMASFGFLAACATQPEPAPAPASPAPTRGLGEPVMESAPVDVEEYVTESGRTLAVERVKDFLPFIDVAMNPQAASAQWGMPMEDHYTRLKIETLNPKASDMQGTASGAYTNREADRDYRKESRGWLSRMMSSKTVNRTLLAEFDLSRPDVKATQALFSASFSSNRQDGESWSTDQSLALYATPWFKVSPNTTVTTKLRMQLADQRESTGGSANVLGALTNAATLIAPTTPLVTYFSAPALTDASNYLDSSVSTLFGRAITEQSTGTMALKTWDGQPLLVVYAAMPDARDIRKTKDRDMLGGWAISLEEPIVSMFTRATQPSEDGSAEWPDYSNVNGADVLAFEMDKNLSIYTYIISNLGLSDRIADLNTTGDPDLARQICNRIDRGLTGDGGFNAWDAAAGVYAAATSDMMTELAQGVMTRAETCAAMARYHKLAGSSDGPNV